MWDVVTVLLLTSLVQHVSILPIQTPDYLSPMNNREFSFKSSYMMKTNEREERKLNN